MILVVDDDTMLLASLRSLLHKAGYEVVTAATPQDAVACVRASAPELVLMDMNFTRRTDGEEGLTLLKQIHIFRPAVPVMLMTAWGSIDLAVRGMRDGAFDFITKPWDNRVLLERISTAIGLRDKEEETKAPTAFDRAGIIGQSPSLRTALDTVRRVAATGASVLITGESGTGKELIAEAIHRNSTRASKPFVKVNLGGMPSSLFESEMFGYRKGAFTGAVADRAGRFEAADGGTIFLDEIGELDTASQVKMLRVLQEQRFEPLGSSTTRSVDVRVVCATNADLTAMVRERTFREDLFYRINLVTIHIPPLRQRREDIPALVRHFIENMSAQNPGITVPEVTDDAFDYLDTLPFPGNIRELKNLVERTMLVSDSAKLTAREFRANNTATEALPASDTTLDELEQHSINKALSDAKGNISVAARTLGLSRQALYRRMKKHNIGQ